MRRAVLVRLRNAVYYWTKAAVRYDEAHGMLVIRGRGDRQFAADRLDTQLLAMIIERRLKLTGLVVAGSAFPARGRE